LVAVVEAIPPVRGKRGRPKRSPARVVADRGYQWQAASDQLRRKRIEPLIAKQRTAHGSGLGKQRWVVERTLSWLHQHPRLRLRYERRADIHEAFFSIACSLICLRVLQGAF
jgi:transposase